MRPTTRALICLSLVLMLSVVVAPRTHAAGAGLVAHAGLAVSDLHQPDLFSDARLGPAVGLGWHRPVGADGWHLGLEAWYQRKGFRRGTLWNQIGLQMRADVLSLPLLVSYWFPGVRFEGRAFAGLGADVILGAEYQEQDQDTWQDVADQTESVAWVLVLGGGMRVLGRWDVDVRYQHGLAPVTDFDWTGFDDRIPVDHRFEDATDSTWTLSLGAWF